MFIAALFAEWLLKQMDISDRWMDKEDVMYIKWNIMQPLKKKESLPFAFLKLILFYNYV